MDKQQNMFSQKVFFLLSLFVGGLAWLIFTIIISFIAIQVYKKMSPKKGHLFLIPDLEDDFSTKPMFQSNRAC